MRLRHRNPHAGRPYVRSDKYDLVRSEVLRLLPPLGAGWTAEELVAALRQVLPEDSFPSTASVRWFATAVRIDLEARGLLTRTGPRRPLRYCRATALPSRPLPTRGAEILIPDWNDGQAPGPLRPLAY